MPRVSKLSVPRARNNSYNLQVPRRCKPSMALLLVLLHSLPALAQSSVQKSRRVLLLGSTDPNTPAMTALTAGVMERFAKEPGPPVEIFSESLDAERFDSPEIFESNFRRKYAGRNFDVVLAVAPAAVAFVQQRGEVLLPGVPVVYGGIAKPPSESMGLPAAFRGVTTEFPWLETVQESLRLLPRTRKVLLIFGCTARTRKDAGTLQETLRRSYPRKLIEDAGCLSIEEYRRLIANQPPQTLVLWGDLSQDREGRLLAAVQAAYEILPHANAPVVSIWSAHLGAGLLGGRMVNAKAVGETMAREAIRVFRGELQGTKGPVQGNWWMWDWKQLRKYGIPESALPPGSQIVNRQLNVWDRYHNYIVAAGLLFLILLSLVIYLLVERSRREAAQARMRELSGALIRAQEEERSRIASELHDDLNQRMGLLTIGIEQLIDMPHDAARTQLSRLSGQSRELSSSIHEISHELHPAKLTYLGLIPAVREICQEVALRHGIDIEVEASEVSERAGPEAMLCLYRVFQEALQNIVRHSGADEVRVVISEDRKELRAQIGDNGRGFDPLAPKAQRGLGLAGMRERMRLVQGRLRVESQAGKGTTLRMSIPLRVMS